MRSSAIIGMGNHCKLGSFNLPMYGRMGDTVVTMSPNVPGRAMVMQLGQGGSLYDINQNVLWTNNTGNTVIAGVITGQETSDDGGMIVYSVDTTQDADSVVSALNLGTVYIEGTSTSTPQGGTPSTPTTPQGGPANGGGGTGTGAGGLGLLGSGSFWLILAVVVGGAILIHESN